MVNAVDIINYLRYNPIHIASLGDAEIDRDSIVVGNNSVIARCSFRGIEGDKSLKCYYRPLQTPHSADDTRYIKCGLSIPTLSGTVTEIDVLISDWVEGVPLSDIVRDKACDFRRLSRAFDSLAYDILSLNYAHCDITPDNIIVDGDRMYVIDMDAGHSPQPESVVEQRLGTPQFIHRHRDFSSDEHVDDFPIAAISTILAALATYHDRESVPQQLVEFGYDDIRNAISFAQQRLVDNNDMVHYHIGEETTNLLGKISDLRGLLSTAIGRDDSPSIQETMSDTKPSAQMTQSWAIDEDEHLVMWLADGVTIDRICSALCRTPADVLHRIKRLSIDMSVISKAREMLQLDDRL